MQHLTNESPYCRKLATLGDAPWTDSLRTVLATGLPAIPPHDAGESKRSSKGLSQEQVIEALALPCAAALLPRRRPAAHNHPATPHVGGRSSVRVPIFLPSFGYSDQAATARHGWPRACSSGLSPAQGGAVSSKSWFAAAVDLLACTYMDPPYCTLVPSNANLQRRPSRYPLTHVAGTPRAEASRQIKAWFATNSPYCARCVRNWTFAAACSVNSAGSNLNS